ncbi:phosphoenolpyruvate--protein phosphotransferase [Acidaminobacter sp. JC074]|uniref:phosphoenolpyruvate--protein phosphotransferase n=1 Tax=Acidaminobacter sp. JC074 TaxID=2530199 RepID=UPI001F0E6CCE|nr:phosphoenolpyruvate--protein phosphotransferase [Acidaminobacter sp. JC074]MCH4888770.1 phosphoenolpyruvate--protein phosphotransferase [Acidaminobacter sp. JC074]
MIKGIKASDGIAIGIAYVIKEEKIEVIKETSLEVSAVQAEMDGAIESGVKALDDLKKKTLETVGESEAEVFEAHKQLLMDPVMGGEIKTEIEKGVSSAYAFESVIDKYITMFQSLDNDYMRERALDLKDIKVRVLKILCGIDDSQAVLTDDAIIVTFDLTPSETVNLDREKTKGFVTEIGGETSHSAIIARTLNIPAVVGVGKEIASINQGDQLIIDGSEGVIYINPAVDIVDEYKRKKSDFEASQSLLEAYRDKASITLDGKEIEVAGNIASVEDVQAVLDASGDGIGLFRSEFLYMNRPSLPTEEEQFDAYKTVLEKMNPKPVTIRTMDIGGDKELDYLGLEKEMNPFLGYRAIRICLKDTELFKTQLRALLRASAYGRLRIMFPMIASLEEIIEAKEILKACHDDLISEGVEIHEYQVGIMIEVPAAAIMADVLAEEVDFFSIGTNDLIQYTTAVDRMNNTISDLYSPYHPAFLRLIKSVVEAGHVKGIEVGMCGNVAGYPEFIPYLLNIGLDELSMSPNMILKARSIVNNHSNESVDDILKLKTKKQVENKLKAE